MDGLISKVTLYDIVAMTIPGAIILLAIIGIIPKETITFMKTLDNSWILVVLFVLISYCIGWAISELLKNIFKKNYFYPVCIMGLSSSVIIAVNSYHTFNDYNVLKVMMMSLVVVIVLVVFLFYSRKLFISSNNLEHDSTEKFLLKKGYEKLNKYYEEDEIKIDDLNDEDIMEKMMVACHALIQTESCYSRIHNYSSLKSFSKNFSGSCMFLSQVFLYLFLQNNGMRFDIIYGLCSLLSIIGSYVLFHRYIFFKKKVDIFVLTYFIDYVNRYCRNNH